MKLSSRYNRVNLLASLMILLITGVLYYAVIHFILTGQLDKDLAIEEQEIVEYQHQYGKLPLPDNFKDQIVTYRLIDAENPVKRKFIYTEYENLKEHEQEPGRSLVTSLQSDGKLVEVTITKSRVEAEDLIRIIFLITLGLTGLLMTSITLVNRLVLNRLWKPFHSILSQIKAFNLADQTVLNPAETKIDEFNELNRAAISMSLRVKRDYKDLKTFTDNASHEMMTPLAVINSKLDSLLQVGELNDQQGELIEDIYHAAGRLSRLNYSLLLLAKIENKLIEGEETVNINELLLEKLRHFHELAEAKKIIVSTHLDEKLIKISRYLADILLNNLVSNAIRHNVAGGRMEVQVEKSFIKISNTGKQALNAQTVFERFNKDASSEGMGLGLAISQQICNSYGFRLTYGYEFDLHSFTIWF